VKYLVAQSDADYAPNIKKLVDEGCNIVIGVGFLIADAIADAAKKNPKTNFAIVDSGPAGVANHKALLFATNQSSFLAGYLAASYSKTGVVATYGGMAFASVTDFMDGYAKGVAFNNTAYLGTLKNKGTGLAPFYDFDSKISQKTKDELKRLALAIASGSLKI